MPAVAEQLSARLADYWRGEDGLSALNWSEADYDALENLAAQSLHAGRTRDAKHLYGFLCRLDPLQAAGFLGLGACCQSENAHANAVAAYSQAAILDLHDPRPSFHAAQCLFQLGQFRKAAAALRAAKLQSQKKRGEDGLQKKIARLAAAVAQFENTTSSEQA